MATNTVFSEASFILGNNPPYKAGNIAARQDDGSLVEFTVARATTATRVAPSGLIESVAANVPRIDYLNGGCGELLIEEQRTNEFTRSEEFDDSDWTKVGLTPTANTDVSPDGTTTADTIAGDGTSSSHRLFQAFTPSAGVDYAVSVFAKAGTNDFFQIAVSGSSSFGFTNFTNFDLSNGTVGTTGGGQSGKIENYGNGWYRCSVVINNSGSASASQVDFTIVETSSAPRLQPWTTSNNVIIWGAQIEEGAYPSSYIPTTASSVTRNADVISLTGAADLLGDSAGGIMIEAAAASNDLTERRFTLSDGTLSNGIRISYTSVSNRINCVLFDGANQFILDDDTNTITDFNKIALRYAVNDSALYVNGVLRDSTTSNGTFSDGTLTKVAFDSGTGTVPFYGRIRQLVIFDQGLLDDEIESVSAYPSFAVMASSKLYTTL